MPVTPCAVQSVEHAYQGQKFADAGAREAFRVAGVARGGEDDTDHGMRVWSAGQLPPGELRGDWDAFKVEAMYLAACAKYAAHEDLRGELASTGDAGIVGAPSTWAWSKFNGVLQMMIRTRVRGGEDLRAVTALDKRALAEACMRWEMGGWA